MRNKKILTTMAVLIFILAAYITLSIKQISVNVDTENLRTEQLKYRQERLAQKNLQKIKKDHSENLAKIIADYEKIVKVGNSSANEDEIGSIKNQLVGLVAPDNGYKMVHLNLALSLDRYEEYIKEGQEDNKQASVELFDAALSSLSNI